MESNSTVRYIMRSLRYVVRMLVLLAIVFAILWMTNLLNVAEGETLKSTFISPNGAMILGLILLLSLVYPKLSFTTIVQNGSILEDRQAIIAAFATYDYALSKEAGNTIVFRSNSKMKRINLRMDDAITVVGEGNFISLEGLKREVIRVDSKLAVLLEESKMERLRD